MLFHLLSSAQEIPYYHVKVRLNPKDATLDGTLNVHYINNSLDTIRFLWFNLYPNAFKNDRTAFSEYMLNKGRTDFYFAPERNRGYINRLDFRSGNEILETQDHPLYIDVIKVLLRKPLAHGEAVDISTPFHVKVPFNYDGIGYNKGEYSLRYWYPAVARSEPTPLTDKNYFYQPIANFDVQLLLPHRLADKVFPSAYKQTTINDSVTQLHLHGDALTDFSLLINPHEVIAYHKQGFRKTLESKLDIIASKPILPAIGYNQYDGFQLGFLSQKFRKKEKYTYYAAPLYTFRSKSIAAIAGGSYSFNPRGRREKIEVGAGFSTFSYNEGADTLGEKVFAKLFKVAPYIRVKLPAASPKIEKYITLKSYLMRERDLKFVQYNVDSFYYAAKGNFHTRYVNELSFDYSSSRVLYPYHAQLQVQQGKNFYRVNATGNYFFNYPKGGGMNVRVFAAKFGYIGSPGTSEKFATSVYQPKLTAVRGDEDYTYSNYFVGRSEFDGFAGRQIMMRDGGLKLRTDMFSGLQGRSDNWVASANLNTTVYRTFPVRIFFDAGTYAEAWDAENADPRFLYVAGLQVSLFKDVLNIYAPVIYSQVFRDQLKTVDGESSFGKTISFSIDLLRFNEFVRK